MIEAKAEDMLEHWVTTVLPGGFKAQVAAVSRKAAVRYHHALRKARDELLAQLQEFDPESVTGTPLEKLSVRQRYLHQACQFRALLRRIGFVPVICPGPGHKRREWSEWTDTGRQAAYVPFDPPQEPNPARGSARGMNTPWSEAADSEPPPPASAPDPVHPDSPVAFLIVKSKLLTGFDAPREQVLYLDRPIRDAELLQAVARVNRTAPGKEVGYVVDYYGVFEHLCPTRWTNFAPRPSRCNPKMCGTSSTRCCTSSSPLWSASFRTRTPWTTLRMPGAGVSSGSGCGGCAGTTRAARSPCAGTGARSGR
jgi:type I restriction enzyme R subunit